MKMRLPALLLLVIGLAVSPLTAMAGNFELHNDALNLMPADPTAIVAISSVDELAEQYTAIMTMIAAGESPESDIIQGLREQFKNFTSYIAMDRPLVIVAGLPNLMAGGEPPFTFILPLLAGSDAETFATNAEFVGYQIKDSYVALTTDPMYAAAGDQPELSTHLPEGVISATLDLATVVTNFGPFAEMGMASIPLRSDENPDGMTAEQVAALSTTMRDVMASLTRLDLSLGRSDNLITWHTGLGIAPGSPMDMGPQPDFDRALNLTSALPGEADFLQVLAFDQTRLLDTFREYYLISLSGAMSGMSEEQALHYRAWVENYLDSMNIWSSPMASAVRMADEGMIAQVIMAPDDADAAVAQLAETIDGVTALKMGYTLTRRDDEKIAGAKFHAWDIDLDLTQLEAVMSTDETDQMQTEQMVAILRKIMPVIYLGAKDDKVFLSTDTNTDDLAKMVKAAGRKGSPVASVAKIAKKTGPSCQQVITGDMLSIVNWMSELMQDLDDKQRTMVGGNPVPFEATVTVNNADLGFDVGMDLEAMGNLIKAAQEWEEIVGESDEEAAAGE